MRKINQKLSKAAAFLLMIGLTAGCSQAGNAGLLPRGLGNQPSPVWGMTDPKVMKNSIILEKANVMETEYVKKIGYTAQTGGNPVVDTGQIKL